MKETKNRFITNFTLLEMLVVISIISVLATLLSPVLSTAREKSRRVSCQNNQRTIGISIKQYAGDNNGSLPPTISGVIANHDTILMLSSSLPTSRVNSHIAHVGYTALHNVNILRNPKVYKCPSRASHDVSDDAYNANLHTIWSSGSSGPGTYGPDQSQTELSYLYFVSARASVSTTATAFLRALLNESHYTSEVNIIRDRVLNHDGYNYGHVLYGDGHVESKEIQGGRTLNATNGANGTHNTWVTFHYKYGTFRNWSGALINTDNPIRYNASSDPSPYLGLPDGLGVNGSINFFEPRLSKGIFDFQLFGLIFSQGQPSHQP